MVEWASEVRETAITVERWIAKVHPDGWLCPRDATWNNKDLLGHLTAWSDLLVDQVEALQQERLDAIRAIDIDAWNADQVARRRNRTTEAIVDDWRRSVARAVAVIGRVPADGSSRAWTVPWSVGPVSAADLARLWLVHVEQHRARLVQSESR